MVMVVKIDASGDLAGELCVVMVVGGDVFARVMDSGW
jgi:hypothetical protein